MTHILDFYKKSIGKENIVFPQVLNDYLFYQACLAGPGGADQEELPSSFKPVCRDLLDVRLLLDDTVKPRGHFL
jgi:hypothetical protein